jgi:hypothetical protein
MTGAPPIKMPDAVEKMPDEEKRIFETLMGIFETLMGLALCYATRQENGTGCRRATDEYSMS